MNKTTWFIFLAIIAISCLDEPDCYQLDNDVMVVSFNVLWFGADLDTLLDIRAPGTDSIFYPNTIGSTFSLPLNPDSKESEYIFRWNNGSIDTLLLGYSSQIQFVSAECGQRYVFGSLTPMKFSFDSVRVFNNAPTSPASTNLVIYRCANPDRAGVKFKTLNGTARVDSALSVSSVTIDFPTQVNLSGTRSSFYLPLNKQADTTTFVFNLEGGTNENLRLSYTRTSKVSPVQDCDSVTFFSNINIAATSFDTTSTKLIKPAGSTSDETNTVDPAIINFEIFL